MVNKLKYDEGYNFLSPVSILVGILVATLCINDRERKKVCLWNTGPSFMWFLTT